MALRDDALNYLRQVFGRERAERDRAESPSAEAEKHIPSSMFAVWGREDVGGLLSVSQNLMDRYADYEAMDDYPDINCLTADTLIYIVEGSVIRPFRLHDLAAHGGGVDILAYDSDAQRIVKVQAENPRITGNKVEVVEVGFDNGESIKCTPDHKFFTVDHGYINASDMTVGTGVVSIWSGFDTKGMSTFLHPLSSTVKVTQAATPAGEEDVYDVTTKTHNFIANGVVVHNSTHHYFTNDATQPDIDTGKTVWVHSSNEAIKDMTDVLLNKRLRIEDDIWSMVYQTVKTGNNYEEVLVTENGVVGLNSLPVPTVRRVEQSNGALIGYVQDITGKFTQDAADLRGMLAGQSTIPDHVALFEEWQVLHSRLRGTVRRTPYGFGVADGARWIWKRLVLLEDAMLIYKLCLRGDSQIWTPDGRTAIKDLEEGDEVYSYTKEDKLRKTKVSYKKHNGQDTIYRVFSDHREIFANKTHPVLVEEIIGQGSGKPRARFLKYVEVQNLEPGKHRLVTPKKNADDWEEIKLQLPALHSKARLIDPDRVTRSQTYPDISKEFGVHHSRAKAFFNGDYELKTETAVALLEANGYDEEKLQVEEHWGGGHGRVVNGVTLPDYVDEGFAQWFGFMLGDGFITTRTQTDGFVTTNEVGFALGDKTRINDRYKKLFERYVPGVKLVNDTGDRLGAYSFISCKFAEFMLLNGFIPGAHNKRVPEWVFRAKPSIKLAFIRGLAEADAHIKPRKLSKVYKRVRYEVARFEMCNEQLLQDVRELAMQLGLVVTMVRSRFRKGGRTIAGSTQPLKDTTSYCLDVTFKQQPMTEMLRGVEEVGVDDIWDIGVEDEEHNFIADGACVHNTRAPARFAFYIDVTDIPSDKVDSFLRKAKQDLRKQKLVNPRCLTGETPVTCLDGKDRSMRELAEEVPKLAKEGKHHYVFSYDTERHRIVPGKITAAGLSGKKKAVYRVVLDSGAIVRCTGDHPFLLRNGSYKQAQDLVKGESLMPLYLSRGSKGTQHYWKYKDTGLGKQRYVHQMVTEELIDSDYKAKGLHVHHRDENKENNHPSNLEPITPGDHAGGRHPVHLQAARKALKKKAQTDPAFKQELYERIRDWREAHPEKLSEVNKKAAATKTVRADGLYNLIFAMVDQKLHNDSAITSQDMVAWLNGQEDFIRIYADLPTTIKSKLSRGCWTALLKRRGFKSFSDYKEQVVGTGERKNGPQKKGRRLVGAGKNNHTVVSVTPDGFEDVYDITVEDYHNFALTAGVFVHNTQRLDMRFNPMDNMQDFFIAVRENRELARVEVLQGPDYQATEDVEYFNRKLHSVLKVPKSYLGQEDAIPPRSILSFEDVRAARVTMGIQREMKNSIRRLVMIDLAARGINPFSQDLQVMMTVPSGIYELAHNEIKNARADFATRVQPFVSMRYIQQKVLKLTDDEIEAIESQRDEEQKKQAEQQKAMGGEPGGPGGAGGPPGGEMGGAPPEGGLQHPGNVEIGPPPGVGGRPNTPTEWKNYDGARRLEERRHKESERRDQELQEKLQSLLSQNKSVAAKLSQHEQFIREFRSTAFARNKDGGLIKAPIGRGHRIR